MIPIEHVIAFAALLFIVGAVGVIIRRNALILLMCTQLMMAGATLALVAFARLHGDVSGQVVALLAIVVTAMQAIIGVGVLVAFYRGRQSLDVDDASELKW